MSSSTAVLRQCISSSGLISTVRQQFVKVADTRCQASIKFTLADTLMAALAMFQLKSPSLLQFDKGVHSDEDTTLADNLKRLFWLSEVPCDSQMRSILDQVSPAAIRPAFRAMHSTVQRARILEN